MNLKQLEAFVCVAEHKSFSKAAGQLFLTQPTVSAHIQALEKELGCRLLIRTTKEVVLSADGERLYGRARQMLQIEQDIRKEFRERGELAEKRIKVGASTVPGQYILPRILTLFYKSFPDYRLELVEGDSREVIEMVQEAKVDVGFTGTHITVDGLIYEPFYYDKLIIVTPNTKKYYEYEQRGFPLGQLYQESLILREEGSGTRQETERYLQDAGVKLDKLKVAAIISNQETIKKSVSNGMGVSIMSSVAAEDFVRRGMLLRFPFAEGEISRKLYMVWNHDRSPDAAAGTFIRFVKGIYEYL